MTNGCSTCLWYLDCGFSEKNERLFCYIYKNGARHTLSDYADMAVRTTSKRAYLQGEGVKPAGMGYSYGYCQ